MVTVKRSSSRRGYGCYYTTVCRNLMRPAAAAAAAVMAGCSIIIWSKCATPSLRRIDTTCSTAAAAATSQNILAANSSTQNHHCDNMNDNSGLQSRQTGAGLNLTNGLLQFTQCGQIICKVKQMLPSWRTVRPTADGVSCGSHLSKLLLTTRPLQTWL